MATETKSTSSWPELAIGLYDKLTGRNAEITYEFQNMEISVPSQATASGKAPDYAMWKLNGVLKIRTKDGVDK
jgi:hypothetical protein